MITFIFNVKILSLKSNLSSLVQVKFFTKFIPSLQNPYHDNSKFTQRCYLPGLQPKAGSRLKILHPWRFLHQKPWFLRPRASEEVRRFSRLRPEAPAMPRRIGRYNANGSTIRIEEPVSSGGAQWRPTSASPRVSAGTREET